MGLIKTRYSVLVRQSQSKSIFVVDNSGPLRDYIQVCHFSGVGVLLKNMYNVAFVK